MSFVRLAACGWVTAVLLIFSGCATFDDRDPPSNLPQSFTFPASDEDLWTSLLETLKAELVPIARENRRSGTIVTGEFPIQKAEFKRWAENAHLAPSGFGRLNLRVFRESPNTSRLEVQADFQSARRSVIRKKGKHNPSTGIFERALAARVFTYLVAKKYPTVMQLVVGCNFRWNEGIRKYEISHVEAGSFGEEQGFREGDVLLAIDDIDISIENFFPILSRIKSSTVKIFTLSRQSQRLELPVQIFYLGPEIPWIGIRVERDIATGVFRVMDVAPSSPAGKGGLQMGDLLLEEEGVPLTNWKNYYTSVTNTRSGSTRKFLVERSGVRLTILVKPERFEMPSRT